MNPKKHRALKYYLDNIKPFLDEVYYLRNMLKIIWMKIYNTKLKLCSIWLTIDLNKIYWLNHRKILYCLISSESAKQLYKKKIQKTFKHGRKNCNIIKIEDKSMYQSFYLHFVRGIKWEETDFYKQVICRIENGESIWGCSSAEEYGKRCEKLDKLYANIKNNGLKSQETLKDGSLLKENRILKKADEITILLGPEGEMIHYHSGNHRLSIAKLLNLDKIPVQILSRHKDWLRFRKEILSYLKENFNGKAYQPLLHPDLRDILSIWSDKRFQLVKQKTAVKKGTLLDIGAHWGYFCHKFEDLGFQCTAIENSERNLYFMKKLKKADNLRFNILNHSIFHEAKDNIFNEELNFDIVLALNLFHQFNDMEEDLIFKLKKIFGRIKAKEVYFQVPEQDGALQLFKNDNGKSRNLSPRELIESIIENSSFIDVEKIGEERNHGIYKIS